MFEDRLDAGRKLANALQKCRGQKALVLTIPKGGVEVGFQVAKSLQADFSIIIARKLPLPDNPEAGFGAIAEDGSVFILQQARNWLPEEMIERIKEAQKKEIRRRRRALREDLPLPEMTGREVILVDDGIAAGSTMRAAVKLCRNKRAQKVIVAAPVAGQDVAEQIEKEADEAVILEKPRFFRAVADSYKNWYDVPDREVIEILREWHKENSSFDGNRQKGGSGWRGQAK